MTACSHFKPQNLSEPGVCRYWEDRPGFCKHPKVRFCPTRGRKSPLPATADLGGKFPDFTGGLRTEEYIKYLRDDSDDDGEIEGWV
jgi:hypothetical protein